MKNSQTIAPLALRWYDKHGRSFIWRYKRKKPNLYYVWLSEVMLQQTQTTTVEPYFKRWIKRFPRLDDVARATPRAVQAAWAGLGYYHRARSLHETARIISRQHGGRFPIEEAELKQLPGIGDYTAAAISAFGHQRFAVVVDGNIKRVLSRLFAIPFSEEEKIKAMAAEQTPKKRAGDYAQALMDIGATLCLTRNPLCARCPLAVVCKAHQRKATARYGRRLTPKQKAERQGKVYLMEHQGKHLLCQRPPKGLLGGTLGFPSSGWDESVAAPPLKGVRWKKHRVPVTHQFTHFSLTLTLHSARLTKAQAGKVEGVWRAKINEKHLPSLMRKVWRAYRLNA